jgi:hypothetical protein
MVGVVAKARTATFQKFLMHSTVSMALACPTIFVQVQLRLQLRQRSSGHPLTHLRWDLAAVDTH